MDPTLSLSALVQIGQPISFAGIKPLIPVILHHHERFDGKGYPDGLKGEGIMLWARMAAVADT
ncbi:MAG: hypothetical protein PHS17_19120, partial [Desulfobacterales bacterium]|nr:hypothetical protein [Desulfobacterales bacterium]